MLQFDLPSLVLQFTRPPVLVQVLCLTTPVLWVTRPWLLLRVSYPILFYGGCEVSAVLRLSSSVAVWVLPLLRVLLVQRRLFLLLVKL